ncbi:hypothetical protein NLI96_g5188 [Meripilus lineatus]|uniref:Vacuolar protein sorting-associated protein 27 n=1 Tax=Meripilus lineatus TaxID=2056292 RepID=A0AAD5V5L5_9APHY|nr:hypothetical protein NLI96_g5188 [Physisporinus lineatus]
MSSLFSSLLWGTSQLDDAVDRATSELLPSGAEDMALNLEICDQIRSKSVQPKDAMRALKRRLNHKNPNVQLLALGLTDVCIKNGGDQFLSEVASREFMDNLVSILKIPVLNHDVKTKILRLIQNWATAFEGKPSLGYVGEVYRTLQREGYSFPPRDFASSSTAMVDTQTAPEWIDSDVCLRNCGQVFDQQCSSKSMTLPHFGITQEVRVCDGCHAKLTIHRPSQSVSNSRHRGARDAADADLQRAIQLSLQEVGAAGGYRPGYVPSPSPWQISEPPLVDRRSYPNPTSTQEEEDDPDLRAAIEASLREASAPKPSAPVGIETPRSDQPVYTNGTGYPQSYPPQSATPKPTSLAIPNYDLEPLEADAILTFSQTVQQVQSQGGRDLSTYPAVTELFDKANGLRPKLAMSMSDTGRKEQLLTEMHEKLSQAVKLYDKLLTEQVSHRPWRTQSPPAASTSTKPIPAYLPQSQPQGQWQTQPQQATPLSPAAYAQPAQASYLPPQQPVTQLSTAMNGLTVGPPPVNSYQPQMYSVPPPPPQAVAPPQAVPESIRSPTLPPASIPQYLPQSSPAGYAPVSIPTGVPPPPPVQAIPPPPMISATPPAHVVPSVQSPTPFSHSPGLSRHNTIASHPTPAAPSSTYNARLPTRSNTIMTHAPQQLQQLQHTAVPTQLPVFPSVPASPPQSLQMYSSTPTPEPERKEALLIEL